MASIRALRGKIHPGLQLCGGVDDASGSVATQPPQDPLALPRGFMRRPQVRPAWRLRQLNAGQPHIMTSIRALCGNIHLGFSCVGEWMQLDSYPALAFTRGVTCRPQVRPAWQLRQLNAGPSYIMASIKALRGKIHPGCCTAVRESGCCSVATQPPRTSRLDSGVNIDAGRRSDPLGDCGN